MQFDTFIIKMEASLHILPRLESKVASQICFIGPKLMQSMNAYIGQVSSICAPTGEFLCQLWPTEDSSEENVMYSDIISKISSKRHHSDLKSQCVRFTLFQKIVKLKCAVVEIVFFDHSKVKKFRNSDYEMFKLKGYLLNLLGGLFVGSGYCVDCRGLMLGKVFGVAYVNFLSTEPENDCGYLTVETKIIFHHVISLERFKQMHSCNEDLRIGGYEHHVKMLTEIITIPSIRQKVLNIGCEKGVLIQGPPGSGKTTLVKYVCHLTKTHLIAINGPDIVGTRPGDTESGLRSIFRKAIELGEEGPCVLFIDEVDSIAPKVEKGTSSSTASSRTTNQLSVLLESLHELCAPLVVIAATSRPAALDPDVCRKGRLDRIIMLGIPNLQQRCGMLTAICKPLTLGEDVKLPDIAEATPGYVAADLASLVRQAWYAAKGNLSPVTVAIGLEHFQTALHKTIPSTQRGSDILVDYKPILWEDIGGLSDVKEKLLQAIEWPIKHPQAFARLGLKPPKGVLLYGPPGCAKTTLVRAAATSCHVTFLAISGAQLYSPYVGDSERKIAEVFHQARAGAPSILFIDEIDSIVGKRATDGNKQAGVQERVLSTLLNQMDGIGVKVDESSCSVHKIAAGDSSTTQDEAHHGDVEAVDNSDVLVVAATNRPDNLDDALIRPGRIDRIIYVPPPDLQTRLSILKVHSRKMPMKDINLMSLAEQTEGFTGADIENLCREAALHCLSTDGLAAPHITQAHFDFTLTQISPSLSQEQMDQYTKFSNTIKL